MNRTARVLRYALAALVVGMLIALFALVDYESYSSLYDAGYVGAEACGECHLQVYPLWQRSPHALMTRPAREDSVVGDFADASWGPSAGTPWARMYRDGEAYVMALKRPAGEGYQAFAVERVVGYQYRQTYLTREPAGVLRRLPLQWSTEQQAFFPYWNFQEHREPTLEDLWAQMQPPNSAWNLFCARCHTTHLVVEDLDEAHTRARTHWVDDGIACEACHGPGSQHVNYMSGNAVNRIVAFLNSRLRGQPVAYIANAPKLDKGQALSVCARCHGSDILRSRMDTYRRYEPGYSREGRINDLSEYFTEAPLDPGRQAPTVETWLDGRPRGIGMLFRSFVESACYEAAEARCYDCHDPHDNKRPTRPGILEASAVSNDYCLGCHVELRAELAAHTRHPEGRPGSFCYDCHMPKHITNAATGIVRYVRTHAMSSIPDPAATLRYGPGGAPNACTDCHADRGPRWALGELARWSDAPSGR